MTAEKRLSSAGNGFWRVAVVLPVGKVVLRTQPKSARGSAPRGVRPFRRAHCRPAHMDRPQRASAASASHAWRQPAAPTALARQQWRLGNKNKKDEASGEEGDETDNKKDEKE